MAIKYRRLLILLCCIIVAVLALYAVFPTRGQLIATPSAHKSIAYLPVSGHSLGNHTTVEFAAFDVAANALQITLAVPRDGKQVISEATLTVDGVKLDDFEVIYQTTFKCQYIHILIKDVGISFKEIVVSYKDNTATIKR